MSKVIATPGVYIQEKNAFSSSVVSVPTAIPAFVGYTGKAMRGTKSLLNKPTRIGSLAEFVEFYGRGPKTTYTIEEDEATRYKLTADEGKEFYLFNSMRLFYANGGGPCYIVSVGNYSDGVKASALNNIETGGGLQSLLKEHEPTMTVIPDAVLLEKEDCNSLQQAMVSQAAKLMDRVAILDVYDGYKDRTLDEEDVVNQFREGVGNNFLNYAAAYYPWLNTTIVQADEIDYTNVSNIDGLSAILNKEAEQQLEAGLIPQKRHDEIKAVIEQLSEEDADVETVSNTLSAVSPTFKDILKDLRLEMNLLPPSACMAGIYSLVDSTVGVHQSPANISLSSVVAPTVNINNEEQEDLNLPLNGKAINAIRGFMGKGVLVWGARTLDGNSQDWRYISVRRTMIMLEQSIKIASETYVFAPNNSSTWANVSSSISNFLLNKWKEGALVGASPSQAFEVHIGLGVTMTPNDILDGFMRVTVKVAVVRPAEFIVITFQQKMQEA
ncbi:MAG: phage tail sheath family protein [Chitinophagales bacterium]